MKKSETTSARSETLGDLVKRARKGDDSALQRMLQNPKLVDAIGGDQARQAELSFIKAAAGDDPCSWGSRARQDGVVARRTRWSEPDGDRAAGR